MLLLLPRVNAFARPAAMTRRRIMMNAKPALVVWDMDDCLWHPEMFTLSEMPSEGVRGDLNGRGEGVVGVRSGSDVIRLFPDALRVLQEFWDGEHDPTKLAVASSADTPFAASIAQAALDMLEIVPGVTLREVLCRGHPDGLSDHIRIGRTPPLSSDKSKTHFPLIREATGIDYDGMLFFDDSNWSDHCAIVSRNCPGVVAQRTPRGLQYSEWVNGLKKFAEAKDKS
jgi:magnesium-dependent phosphatase 1